VVAPPGKIYGRYTRPHIRFGRPLDFSRYQGMESDRYVLRSITDEIMYEIMQLSGQEYVDVYATKAKDDAKAAAAAAKAEAKGAKAAKDLAPPPADPPVEPAVVDPPADIPPAEPPAA
jgi:1-acyl-sn-glycerol-3-phosphate acyltransferase